MFQSSCCIETLDIHCKHTTSHLHDNVYVSKRDHCGWISSDKCDLWTIVGLHQMWLELELKDRIVMLNHSTHLDGDNPELDAVQHLASSHNDTPKKPRRYSHSLHRHPLSHWCAKQCGQRVDWKEWEKWLHSADSSHSWSSHISLWRNHCFKWTFLISHITVLGVVIASIVKHVENILQKT